MAVNLWSVIYLRTVALPCSDREQIGPMAENDAERGALKSLAASGTRIVITGQNGTGLAAGSNVELFRDRNTSGRSMRILRQLTPGSSGLQAQGRNSRSKTQ
jgi:hypothetical protein